MSNSPLYRPTARRVLALTAAVAAISTLHLVAAQDPWPPPGVLKPGNDVSVPRLIEDPRPNYTTEAMRNRIQGVVNLAIVVDVTGTVRDVRVIRSLDKVYGLDAAAVETVKKWRFAPALKDGVAVPVAVEVEMTFTLRGGPRGEPPRATPGPLSWPAAFLPTDRAARITWIEDSAEGDGLKLRVAYPQGWALRKNPRPGHVLDLMSEDFALFVIVSVGPGAHLPREPLPADSLERFFAAMKERATARATVDTTAVGQIQTAARLWLWHEAYVRQFDLSTAPPPIRDSIRERVGGVTVWTFVTAAVPQTAMVTCTLTHPPGAEATAVLEQQRRAGELCGETVRRLTIETR